MFEGLGWFALNLLCDHPPSPHSCAWETANELLLIILQTFTTRNTISVITIPSVPEPSWYRNHCLLCYFILPCTFQALFEGGELKMCLLFKCTPFMPQPWLLVCSWFLSEQSLACVLGVCAQDTPAPRAAVPSMHTCDIVYLSHTP